MPRVKTFDEQVILEKAMHLFWQKGYHATSIQDLVSHLGVNRASLYDTYGGKKQLFEKALQHYRTTSTAQLKTILEAHDDVKEGIKALFSTASQSLPDNIISKGCFVVNTTTELLPGNDEMKAIVAENKQYIQQILFDYLSSGVKKGDIAPNKDLKALAALLFTFYNGIRVISKIDHEDRDIDAAVTALLPLLD